MSVSTPIRTRLVIKPVKLRNTDVEAIAAATTDNYFKLFSSARRPVSLNE